MIETVEDVEALVDAFGDEIEVAGMTTLAVWGDPFVEVPSDESSVAGSDASALVTRGIADAIPEKAILIHQGVTYRVAFKEPDETGVVVRLVLDKVPV